MSSKGDCNDSDPLLNVNDEDGDGFSTCEGDCEDSNPLIHPDKVEICNGYDDDCDTTIDSEDSSWDSTTGYVIYLNNDGDGVGDTDQMLERCHVLSGYVLEPNDCDDSNALLNPYDEDGDGFSTCEGDCEDSNPLIHPDKVEICNDVDDDCDGLLNEEDDSWDSTTGIEVYTDHDGDGSGAIETPQKVCFLENGFVEETGDCDDTDSQKSHFDLDEDGFSTCEEDCDDEDFWSVPFGIRILEMESIKIVMLSMKNEDIKTGGTHTCGIDENNEIICFGSDDENIDYGQVLQSPNGSFVGMDTGLYHNCAVNIDREVEMLGSWKKQYL